MTSEYKSLELLINKKKKEIAEFNKKQRRELQPLVQRQKLLANQLYELMQNKNLDSYNGISIEDVAPKERKKKISKDDQMNILRQNGVRNPEDAMREMGILK